MGLAASRQEAFWEACGFGNVHRVRRFLQDGDVDVNWVSYTNDCCPIHVASQGKPEIVKLLIDANCDVNVIDARGNLPLHHAAMKGHADIVQTLINAGSEVNVQEKRGWTPLHNAAYWCNPEVVKVLLKNGCNVHIDNKDQRTVLHELARSQAADEGQLGEIAQMLIDAGIDINAKSSALGEADLTALMYAAYHNHPDIVSTLTEAGCELNSTGTTFWTALHWAADRGHDEVVYILLEADADPTKKGMRGETAADRAQSDSIREILEAAMKGKHDMDRADPNLLNVLSSRAFEPGPKYVPKCDAGFKSKSFLPKDWKPSSINYENMLNEKKTELSIKAAKEQQNAKLRANGILDYDYESIFINHDTKTDEDKETHSEGATLVDTNTGDIASYSNENGLELDEECLEKNNDENQEVVSNTQAQVNDGTVVCNGNCENVTTSDVNNADIDVQVSDDNVQVKSGDSEVDSDEVSSLGHDNTLASNDRDSRMGEDYTTIEDHFVDNLKLGEQRTVAVAGVSN